MWWRCSSQIWAVSSFSRGTPRASVAEERASSRDSISRVVVSVPLVVLLQCLIISSLEMAFLIALSEG